MAEVPTQLTTDKPPSLFPDYVLIKIFLNLPVRSLFLFRSVSKHWLRLIQSPNFVNLHIIQPTNNRSIRNPMLIVRAIKPELEHGTRNPKKIILSLISDDETLGYRDDVALEMVSPSITSRGLCFEEGRLHLLGPCKGLFCITDTVDVVIFNPSTKECRNVPHSPLSKGNRDRYYSNVIGYFDCVGFGFDSVSNDFKVVKVHEIEHEEFYKDYGDDDDDDDERYNDDSEENDGYSNGSESPNRGHRYKVEIFSLSANSWRQIDCVVPSGNLSRLHSYNVFFNGAFHWLAGDDEYVSSILVFDLKEEAFKQFELPESYNQEYDDIHVYLSVVNKSLALIVHREFDCSDLDDIYEIWVMKKYGVYKSWKELFTTGPVIEIEKPLSFGKGWEFLVENGDGKLVSFNLKTKEIEEFDVHGVPGSMRAFRFRESLVSLKRESLVSLKRAKRKRM